MRRLEESDGGSHLTLPHRRPDRDRDREREQEWAARGGRGETVGDWGRCAACRRQQKKAVMLQSEDDEYLCQECFRKEFYEPTSPEGPAAVEAREDTRRNDRGLLFPYLEPLMKTDKIKSKFYRKARPSTISKRPVVCPYAQCRRHVGVLSFDGHFKYEHAEVPVVATHADSRTSVHFYPQDAAPGRSHCLLLLNLVDASAVAPVGGAPSFATNSSGRLSAGSPVTFVLLATRVAALQLSDDEEERGGPDLLADPLGGADPAHPLDPLDPPDPLDPFGNPDDRVFLWLASNLSTDFSYTVAASTLDGGTRVKYYGPVPPLPASSPPRPPDADVADDDPVEMCECGKGLTLTGFQCGGMTGGARRPLVLDVVVHPPDD